VANLGGFAKGYFFPINVFAFITDIQDNKPKKTIVKKKFPKNNIFNQQNYYGPPIKACYANFNHTFIKRLRFQDSRTI